MKKTLGIIIVTLAIIISLALSIYLPNKDKINDEVEDKSIIYSVIESDGKFGVKNQNDETIIEPQYEKIIIPNEHRAVFICQNDDEQKIYNEKNEQLFKNYDDVEPIKLTNLSEETYESNALICMKNGKYGLLSITGKVLIDVKYEDVYSLGYKSGEIIVKDNNKYMIYDTKGKELIKDEFDSIKSDEYYTEEDEYAKSGYIVCKTTSDGYRYGYYDYEYNMVLDVEYNEISRIIELNNKNIYLIASQNGQYGVFINNTKIINTQYQSINYNDDLKIFIVERTGKFGAFNENGTEIIKSEYDNLKIQGIYIYAEKGEEKKVFDKNGKDVNISYTTIIEQSENSNYYIKKENEKYGIVNLNMETIINCEYDLIQSINGTNAFQAIRTETNTTFIFNKDLQKVVEMNNATTEVLDNQIRIYNDTEEIKLDFDGNVIK